MPLWCDSPSGNLRPHSTPSRAMDPEAYASRVAGVTQVCIARIEELGVQVEGIYRVSGASSAVKALFAELKALPESTAALEKAVAEVSYSFRCTIGCARRCALQCNHRLLMNATLVVRCKTSTFSRRRSSSSSGS